MKICCRCKVEKDESCFSKNKCTKDGLKQACKSCIKIESLNYRLKYPNEIKARKAKYHKENSEKIKEHSADYYIENSEKIKERVKIYRLDNPEQTKERSTKYYEENKCKLNLYHVEYERQRKLVDPLYKLSRNIRVLVRSSFKNNGFKKSTKTAQILGCTYEEFMNHIESQFQEGMKWDNYGLWHLDHIYPVSLAESEEHLIQLNYYTNFQPLWAEDNIKKSNKLPEELL